MSRCIPVAASSFVDFDYSSEFPIWILITEQARTGSPCCTVGSANVMFNNVPATPWPEHRHIHPVILPIIVSL
jgi:hypothetical protein